VRRLRALVPVLALLVLTGCGSGDPAGLKGAVAEDGSIATVVPIGDRKAPIALAGKTLEGEPLDLASLRGRPVVLNVWGSWCSPCRKEAPELVAAAKELGARASFLGLDIRDDVGQAQAFQRHYQVTYPSLLDEGDLLLSLRSALASTSPPVTLVLDPQGRVAGRFVGPVTRRTLVDMVTDVTDVAGPGATTGASAG
jgi:thiol-disulfide isomerase/thioredoxin